ncbi:MAG: hypothetical protein NC409_06080 [Clostridium sp.]|nr:hypothetical protein [Clostridium sp.]
MEQHRIVPFYQTYNMPAYQAPYLQPYAMNGYLPLYMAQGTDVKEDLQYLQEMFPELARRYAAKIASAVDRLDYKGSMIYDEYPDRLRLQRLARDITQMIEKEEASGENGSMTQSPAADNGNMMQSPAAGSGNMMQSPAAGNGNQTMPADSRYREELVYVLLIYEIAKRRHGAGMDLSKFYGVSGV